MTARRPPRPYRGGKRRHTINLAFNAAEPRDAAGRWVFSRSGSQILAHTVSGDYAGFIEWTPSGMISRVGVQPEHRRKGLATELAKRAKKAEPRLHHSPSITRTPEGDAWARSINLSVKPHAEHPVPAPGMPGGPGRMVDLAVAHDVSKELRDHKGRWVRTVGSSDSVDFENIAQHWADQKWQQAVKAAVGSSSGGFFDDPDQTFALKRGTPERAWAAYQCQMYTQINNYLREGRNTKIALFADGTDAKELADGMIEAFQKMGTVNSKPVKVFRVQGSDYMKPEDLHLGQIVTEKGVISTSSSPDSLADFLDDNGLSHNPVEHPFLMEIHVPAGTRMLGGGVGGIETMLAPGTKFKVTKIDQTTTLSDGGPKHMLPKVTLEVVP